MIHARGVHASWQVDQRETSYIASNKIIRWIQIIILTAMEMYVHLISINGLKTEKQNYKEVRTECLLFSVPAFQFLSCKAGLVEAWIGKWMAKTLERTNFSFGLNLKFNFMNLTKFCEIKQLKTENLLKGTLQPSKKIDFTKRSFNIQELTHKGPFCRPSLWRKLQLESLCDGEL